MEITPEFTVFIQNFMQQGLFVIGFVQVIKDSIHKHDWFHVFLRLCAVVGGVAYQFVNLVAPTPFDIVTGVMMGIAATGSVSFYQEHFGKANKYQFDVKTSKKK